MPLLKRFASWILILLLVVVSIFGLWIYNALAPSEKGSLVSTTQKATKPTSPSAPSPIASIESSSSKPVTVTIDPANKAHAEELNAPDSPPQHDVEIVNDFIGLYRKAFGSNPVGNNEDVTAALTGSFGQRGRVFPPTSRAIKDGQLVDRWGTPFWFHAESGTKMEIRSAGPDKKLFTQDDILLSP